MLAKSSLVIVGEVLPNTGRGVRGGLGVDPWGRWESAVSFKKTSDIVILGVFPE